MANVDPLYQSAAGSDLPKIDLTTAERRALAQALQSAYYNPSELEQFVYFGLGEKLDEVAAPGTLPARVMALVQWAEAAGRIDEVIRAAYEHKPGNPRLAAFRRSYHASVQRQVSREALERLTDSAIELKNPVRWRDRMAQVEGCVCRVLVGGEPAGTGFLAGPGLVITNYHVVHGSGAPIQVEFGYRVGADGAVERGQRYDVTGAPLFERPFSAVDMQYPKRDPPAPEELDIAVLPVAGAPELAQIDDHPRGTIAPAAAPRLAPGQLVTIIQHPKGAPLQFAYDRVLELNANGTRVSYKVQTLEGSSGSPCFDTDWNLVAIHHSGDPRTGMQLGEYNEGIPIATIRASLPPELVAKLGWNTRGS